MKCHLKLEWPELANIIREVDGNHDLGAGELAERILEHPRIAALVKDAADADMVHEQGTRIAILARGAQRPITVPCSAVVPVTCVKPSGHDGRHEDDRGMQWWIVRQEPVSRT